MGYVGNEFRLKVLAAHPVVHRGGDGLAEIVQFAGMTLQVRGHFCGVDVIVGVAADDLFGAPADLFPVHSPPAQIAEDEQRKDDPHKQPEGAAIIITSEDSPSIGSLYLNSDARQASTGICIIFSNAYFPTMPT